jgi:hypothetical protein
MNPDAIISLLQSPSPCLIGRFGTIECQSLFIQSYSAVLERNAGIFGDQERWKKVYRQSVKEADCLALGWYQPTADLEKKVLEPWSGIQVSLRTLEPYYVESAKRWTNCLAGKKVCVVTSFAESARSQLEKKEQVWKGMDVESLLPLTTIWSFVQTGYAPSLAQGRASWSDIYGESIEDWSEAVEVSVKEIMKTDAEIVLLGCGGLAMVIGAELKRRGKKCIVLGGAVQVLFGIKGGRWANHSVIGKFWNEYWIWPSEEETPRGALEVEGGCYWERNIC